jgi:hypothetical protein
MLCYIFNTLQALGQPEMTTQSFIEYLPDKKSFNKVDLRDIYSIFYVYA